MVEKPATALSDTQVRVELAAVDTDGLAVGHDAYRFDRSGAGVGRRGNAGAGGELLEDAGRAAVPLHTSRSRRFPLFP
ncbi:MAG: hypothetical protein U0521_17160 [Anaerolineae bacterium]